MSLLSVSIFSLNASSDPFAERLLPGEEVIWQGRPKQGLLFRESDAFLMTFGLFFTGGTTAAVLTVYSWGISGPVLFLFVMGWLFSLFSLFGRFLFDAWIRARVFYALTDRRILIVRYRPWSRFLSIDLDKLPGTTLKEAPSGRGTITFGHVVEFWNRYDRGGIGLSIASLEEIPQFLAIENAKQVFASIEKQAGTANGSAERNIVKEQ